MQRSQEGVNGEWGAKKREPLLGLPLKGFGVRVLQHLDGFHAVHGFTEHLPYFLDHVAANFCIYGN